ncbi:GEF1 [[Candida] subhashii]|uniref:GEF1 n=1 Tax=[Candida] subhashii TaxID=561895 RepID=A0A8J5QSH9_9ASCO|nr:GEF1 [[Candida] subhashii]KAG7664447.1 GEF1 [[Candida] subhashii]
MTSYIPLDEQQFLPTNPDQSNPFSPEEPILLRSKTTGKWLNQDKLQPVQRFDDFRTIDWVEDELDEHKQRLLKSKSISGTSIKFKDKIIAQIQNWVVLAIMGIIIGLIAGCLNIITAFLSSLKNGHCKGNLYLNESFCCWHQEGGHCKDWVKWTDYELVNYLLYIILSISFSFTAAVLVKTYGPNAAGSGISEIKCIISGFVMDGFLNWSTLVMKSVGLPLVIGSGLSVGKEGPSVHYAVCVGNSIAKFITKYRKSASKGREFLTATSAAGVAVAFGSPMGGSSSKSPTTPIGTTSKSQST